MLQNVRNGSIIRVRRKRHGLTLADVAGRMGIAVGTLSDYEAGRYEMSEARFEDAQAAIAAILWEREQDLAEALRRKPE